MISITAALLYNVHFNASVSNGLLSHVRCTSVTNLHYFEFHEIRKVITAREKFTVRFHASAANWMITAFFWAVTQRVVVIHYRRFGTTHHPHPIGFLTLEDGTDRFSRNVYKE